MISGGPASQTARIVLEFSTGVNQGGFKNSWPRENLSCCNEGTKLNVKDKLAGGA